MGFEGVRDWIGCSNLVYKLVNMYIGTSEKLLFKLTSHIVF